MGYRIEYDREKGKYEVRENRPSRFPLMLAAALGLFALSVVQFWPEWGSKLQSFLIPGEDAVTVQAFQIMTDDLRSGVDLKDAVESFCRYVLHGK